MKRQKTSNRQLKKMRDYAEFCKRNGYYSSALSTLKSIDELQEEKSNPIAKKDIGLWFKKLKSASYVTVPRRARVTKSNSLGHYLQGDYYYSDLNCVFKRA